jgi:hypothetical protein
MTGLHVHRFGFGDFAFELETDWPALADHWRRYTAFFETGLEPTVRYKAWRQGNPVLERTGHASQQVERDIDLYPMLEDAFLTDLVSLVGRSFPVYHGAVLAEGGEATIYLGEPNAGKSTLCVERVQKGATYLSDEMAAVDGNQVIAIPRPICFNNLENPPDLIPDGDKRFEGFGYAFVDKAGQMRQARFFLPPPERTARAGRRFPIKDVVFLDSVANGPPKQILLAGPEKRARLALSCLSG